MEEGRRKANEVAKKVRKSEGRQCVKVCVCVDVRGSGRLGGHQNEGCVRKGKERNKESE